MSSSIVFVILFTIFLYTSDTNAKNVFFRYTENYLHAFGNSKTTHGLIIQYDKRLAALLDGNNGTGILIDINQKTIYPLEQAWSYSTKYFYSYVKSLESLEKIYEEVKDNGQSLLSKVSEHLHLKALKILKNLVSNPIYLSKQKFIDSLNNLIDMNTGVTQHLYPGYHYYYIDIFFDDIVNEEKALADILQGIDGGLPKLAKENNTKINMYEVFKASSPAVIILTYFKQLGSTCDLTKFPVLNVPLKLNKVFADVNGQRDLLQLLTVLCRDEEAAKTYLEKLQQKGEEIKKLLKEIHESQKQYGDIKEFVQKKCRLLNRQDIRGILNAKSNSTSKSN